MASNLATGAKVSWKQIPCFSAYSFTTNLHLCLLSVPSEISLILNTHLVPRACLSGGIGTSTHILFLLIILRSSSMEALHSGICNALSTLIVSNIETLRLLYISSIYLVPLIAKSLESSYSYGINSSYWAPCS